MDPTLDERELCVLNGRGKGKTLVELGKTILRVEGNGPGNRIDIERVRQRERKAIRKLRHPSRLLILRGKVRTLEEFERLKKMKYEELLHILY